MSYAALETNRYGEQGWIATHGGIAGPCEREVSNVPDEPVVEEGLGSSRISRRGLIKAGAIVGGTVWVAPAIDSFTNVAAAQSGMHACCQCSNSASGASPGYCEKDDFRETTCQSDCLSHGFSYYQYCGPSPATYTCSDTNFCNHSSTCGSVKPTS